MHETKKKRIFDFVMASFTKQFKDPTNILLAVTQ